MPRDRNLLCCLIILTAGIFLSVLYYSYPVHDYGNYYYGSRFAIEGKNINDIYEPWKFNLDVRDVPGMQHEKFLLNYAVVPPFTIFFYMPFTFFDVHLSKFLFNVFSILVFSFFLYRLLRLLNVQSKYILLLPLLVLIPFRNNFLFGQTYLLITGLIMGGFIAESKNKNLPAAIYYSLAIILKISPAILLLYLLLRKKFRLLLLTTLISAALFFSAASITGWDLMMDYLLKYVPRMSLNEINNPYAGNYQSFIVLLRNIFIPDRLLNPDALFNAPLLFSIAGGTCMGILIFLLIRKIKITASDFSSLAFILTGSMVLTAYTSSYSLVFLIPLCIHVISQNPKPYGMLLLIFVAANIPVSLFQHLPVMLRFPRLYLLIILFLLITLDKKILFPEAKWLVASVAFFIALSLITLKNKNDNSEYFLSSEAGLLSYDFNFSGNKLLLKTLGENGINQSEHIIADSVYSLKPLAIVNHQVYNDGPVTTGNDKKLNPVLINNTQVIYLSDKNRGIGFYTLRKIDLGKNR